MSSSPSVVLRLSDVVKTYPGVVALKGVSFEVDAGEVHALVGENGAGKSTLMAVAAGSTLPDRGTIEIGGQAMAQPSPLAAQALGLAVVYQHLSILEDLTVAENMVFAMPAARRPSMAVAGGWTSAQLAVVGVEIDPAARVNELSIADRQLLEIAKALALESKVLVLDEPTESLTPVESARLFEQIRTITEAGTAVVYISHRLPEVKRVADRITVLRDGETRGTFSAADVSEEEILNLIIGRSVDQVFPEKRAAQSEAAPLFEVEQLSGHRFRDVDVAVKPGEIVGLAGVEGNGQRELMRALAGLGGSSGEVRLDGTRISVSDPGAARRAGVVYLPGDRHAEGMLLSLGVRENVSLLALPSFARFGFVQRLLERRAVSGEVERLTIRTPGLETPTSSLSGGNQQKVLFARSLLAEPTVLLADEPTRGVDAGARMELYQVLRRTADEGKAVVILSSDSIELQGLCDRVLVFSRGRIVRSLEGDQITEENITGTAITSTSGPGAAATQREWSVRRLRRFVAGDYMPSVILAAIVLGLGLYTTASNGRFYSAYNFQSMLLLASALVFIAFGQLIVLMTGGIDLSVGPLAGLVVVVLSFFAAQGQSGGLLALGILCALGVALLVGLVNGLLIRGARLAPVLATLSTYIAIQGVSELLRPVPAGFFRSGVVDALETNVGWFPVAFILSALVGVGCEILLRRSRAGLELRAVGSDETRAHRLGARVTTTHLVAYALCSLFSAIGGFVLAAQVAVGDASLGTEYTLTSITAVVLGGASIFGGRGSFVGAFFGALLIQEIVTATTFLQIGVAWQYWLPGILILGGAGLYSRARGMKAVTLGADTA
jgi:ribose transport system permease protein/ribose transport system ATP-binding protein